MNENSLIKDIGRSYIVSSFIPAALFLAIAMLIFKDFAPAFLSRRLISNDQLYAGQWVILILMTAWAGFALYSGWNTTVRLFEGYYFPKKVKNKLIEWIVKDYQARNKTIDQFKRLLWNDHPTPEEEKWMNETEPSLMGLQQDLEMNFPVSGNLLPTRLGNLLRASERYSFDRYGIEAITIFPRLVHLLPTEFNNQLEEANNKFIFLLNSSFMAFIISLVALLVSILRVPCYLLNENLMQNGALSGYGKFACTFSPVPTNFFQAGFRHLDEWKYFFIGLNFLVFGYILYRVATVMARAYANLIRASYDLYRYELLKNLNIKPVNNFEKERQLWINISNFFNNGGEFGRVPLDLGFKPNSEELASSSPSIKLDVTISHQKIKYRKRRP